MTHAEKDLLLKDLCARVPYGVKFNHEGRHTIGKILSIYPHRKWVGVIYFDDAINHPKECDMGDIKPYLFPLSSMTEEQKQHYHWLQCHALDALGNPLCFDCYDSLDWLNENHFDYRGLIPMGLANDATGLNIY